jgi:N-acetylglucosamine-6-phosphate deacetylase
MKIHNAWTFTEEGDFALRDVWVKEDKIEAVRPSGMQETPEIGEAPEETIDGTGLYLIPGLTDIHFHGCNGVDFCHGTEEAFRTMASYEARNGVTTICPATMTYPEEKLSRICQSVRAFLLKRMGWEPLADLVGIRMEGPFLSMEKRGAQNPLYIRPADVDMYRRLQEQSGKQIKIVDVAPETEGAMEFIREVQGEVICSLAHTMADYDTAMKAFAAGANHVTHLYNAMPPFSHRAPGVVGAASDTKNCQVELICDGVHVHPSVCRSTFYQFGKDRVILISDSMMAAGMADGAYTLGGQAVYVQGKTATLADGTIAGSASNLMQCLQTAVREMQIPLEWAVWSAAVTPAKSIGIYDRYGSITEGKKANLVLLDANINLVQVILNGKPVTMV